MDQATIGSGIVYFINNREPKSLVEWNAEYEAQRFQLLNEWWFRAGAAVIRSIRSAVAALSTQPATASQLIRA